MIQGIRHFSRSRLAKDCIKLVSGSMATQIVAIGTAPIMARLYGPGAYGVLALFTIISMPISIVSTLQYDQAIVLPQQESEAAELFWEGIRAGSLICISLLILFGICAVPLAYFVTTTTYEDIIWMIPLALALSIPNVLSAFATAWVVRIQRFGELSASRFFINLISTFTAMGIGFVAPTSFGLIAGLVAGNTLGLALLYATIKKNTPWLLEKRLGSSSEQLKKYVSFPKYSVPNVLAMQATAQLPLLLLTGLLGPFAAGLFNMANRLLGLPNTLLVQAFSEVFKQRIAKEVADHGSCRGTYVKTGIGLASVVVPATFILTVIAPDLFSILLGEKWREAGAYSRILCWKFAVHMICGPLSAIFVVRQKLGEDLVVQSSFLVLTAICTTFSFWLHGSPYAIIAGFSAASIMIHSYYIVRGYFLTR